VSSPNNKLKEKLDRVRFVGKAVALLITFLVLLIAIPLGFMNPQVGSISSFNVYRVTGGLSFYPNTRLDFVFLTILSFGIAFYYIYYKRQG
jgi:hypothetical protein